jgi:hypothetical protein
MAKVAIPMSEFGNPKTSAWSESITLLQLRVSLILHEGVKPESFNTLNLSIVKMKDARKPEIPARSITQAESDLRLGFINLSISR